jgi:hypothetical protein
MGSMLSDFAWIIKLVQVLFLPQLDYKIILFIVRLAWIFFIIQYQALALFIESLVVQKYRFSLRQALFLLISSCFCMIFLFITIFDFDCIDRSKRFALEPFFQDLSVFYVLFPLILPSVYLVLRKVKYGILPLILKKQVSILITGLIIPILVADFIQVCPFKIRALEALAHNYAAVSFTTILLTLAIYFCARKIFGLRFLNLKTHVQRPMNMNFIDDFKGVLERLSGVTSCRELGHIVQNFFKDTFGIPITKTHLYFRKTEDQTKDQTTSSSEETIISLVETFLVTHSDDIYGMIKEEKVLIYDEIDFTHFYDACDRSAIVLQFLRTINADIFLPIHEKGKLIAYIIVERHARRQFL